MTADPQQELSSQWKILLGCTLGVSLGAAALYIHSSGAFVAPLAEDAGFSAKQLGFATLGLSLSIVVAAPIVGHMMDRHGSLKVIACSLVCEALVFLALAAAPARYPVYFGLVILLAAAGAAMTPVGFARIITTRFDRRRGVALGIMTAGAGLTGIVAPPLSAHLIAALGWRGTFAAFGVLVLVVGGAALAVIRADRATAPAPCATEIRNSGDETRVSGIVTLFALPVLVCGGYLLHLIELLQDRGFAGLHAAYVQSLTGGAILIGRIATGAALDRLSPRVVTVFIFSSATAGVGLLAGDNGSRMVAGAFALGLAIGAELDLLAYILSRRIRPGRFGSHYGLAYSALILAGGVSPLLLAWLVERGGYDLALSVSFLGAATAAAAALFVPGLGRTARLLASSGA